MSRIKLKVGKQRLFLNRVSKYFEYNWPKIAKLCSLSERTIRDWRIERYNMSYAALLKLHKISNISIPKAIAILPEYWSTRKAGKLGAIKRNEIYGNPGTPEGRSKGGSATIKKFRENPEFAKRMSFKLRTPIKTPGYSPKLAEFVRLMLGDGFIKGNKTQVGISFNKKLDYEHAKYIQSLIKYLFNLDSSVSDNMIGEGADLLVSSKNLVDFLIDIGLKSGSKVKNQVGIPEWISSIKEYRIYCLRGLIDTDGSFYSYRHRVNGRMYTNYALDDMLKCQAFQEMV